MKFFSQLKISLYKLEEKISILLTHTHITQILLNTITPDIIHLFEYVQEINA